VGLPRIAVVTASLPERHGFRAEAIRAVAEQTLQPVAHLVAIDYERVGPGEMLNRMLPAIIAADAEWIAQAADDDLLYPHHLETLYAESEDADILYPYCDVEGREWSPNAAFDADRLRRENYIPATTMIRASLCADLGWKRDTTNGWEDWDFWLRALDAGARFRCVPVITWRYRFHGSNLSWRTG
jgi:GT2 family glycosyltransferase